MAAAATGSYLPDELWERIFKFLNDEVKNIYDIRADGMLAYNLSFLSLRDSFKSLSGVSKQFLSITNSLRFSVTITDRTIPFIPLLFERFPNVTSLNITLSSRVLNVLNTLLILISTLTLNIKSLALYHPIKLPTKGLRAFSQKMKNLTSITCYRIASEVYQSHLFFFADWFPFLDELMLTDLGYPPTYYNNNRLLALPKLRKIVLSRNFIGTQSINHLCRNCDLLQDVKVIECRLTHQPRRLPQQPPRRAIGNIQPSLIAMPIGYIQPSAIGYPGAIGYLPGNAIGRLPWDRPVLWSSSRGQSR
ncbi:hypothetical protein MTR_4g016660 [Medicago truncatula]|uniref:Uncharacterized protein n=2 Tax=Medicago truncatula TaxID=3880 RepID=G7JP42_MEDTR|nr:hypothetical protein MTR_4g016660 [Medicago truncatula]